MDQKQIPAAIIIGAIIIGGAVLLKGTSAPAPVNNNIPAATLNIKAVDKNEHILGNSNAEVVVVEYSDTECPFCKRFHETMHQIVSENNSKVAWVYRHYPIEELHKKAQREAEATECAWEQGGNSTFWKYVDEVFVRTNSNDSLPDFELPKIAGDIGLDVQAFNACLNSGKFAAKVQSDLDSGNAIGVRGTPFSIILKKGKVIDTIPGALPLEDVRQKIKAALN